MSKGSQSRFVLLSVLAMAIWGVLGFWGLKLLVAPGSPDPFFGRGFRAIYPILISIYGLGFVIPIIIFISKNVTATRDTWKRVTLMHVGGSILFVMLHLWLLQLAPSILPAPQRGFRGPPPGRGPFLENREAFARARADLRFTGLAVRAITPLSLYWVVVGMTYSVAYYRKSRERELAATRLEGELAKAQLHALRNQIHPHFLFNSLHTLSSLIYEDVEAADKMIRQLSDLLRVSLDTSNIQETPLHNEIEVLNLYLDIMKTRFQDRLQVDIEVPESLQQVRVPSLILQPIFENAIKHGLEKVTRPAKIKLIAQQNNDLLELVVEDNGPGGAEIINSRAKMGVGLENTQSRIRQLYGDRGNLAFEDLQPRGLRVTMTIPISDTAADGSEVSSA